MSPVIALGIDARPALAGAKDFEASANAVRKSAREAAAASAELNLAMKLSGDASRAASEASKASVAANREAALATEKLQKELDKTSKSNREVAAAVEAHEKAVEKLSQAEAKYALSTSKAGATEEQRAAAFRNVATASKNVGEALNRLEEAEKRRESTLLRLTIQERAAGQAAAEAGRARYETSVHANRKLNELKSLQEAEEKAARAAARSAEETRRSFRQIGEGSRELDRARSSVAGLHDALSRGAGPASGVLRSVGLDSDVASEGLDSLAKSAGLSSSALLGVSVGAGVAAAGVAALGGGLKFAVEQSLAYDRALEAVNARLRDGSLEEYRDQLRELSAATRFGLEDLGAGAAQALQSGYGGAAESLRFVSEAALAARANVVPLGDGIRVLDDTMDAFSLTADRTREVAEKLTIGARRGETDFRSFGAAVAHAGTRLAPLGADMDEVIAVLSQITRRGVPAQEAVTGLSTVLLRAADPTDQLSKKLRAMGIEADANAIRTRGLVNVLRDISTAIGNNPAKLTELFGSPRTAAAFFAAIENGAEGAQKALDELARSGGSIGDAIGRGSSTAAAKLDLLEKQARAFGTKVGDSLTEGIVNAVESGGLVGELVGLITRSNLLGVVAGELSRGPIKAPKIDVPDDLASQVAIDYRNKIRAALEKQDFGLAEKIANEFQEAQRTSVSPFYQQFGRELMQSKVDQAAALQANDPKKLTQEMIAEARQFSLAMTDVNADVKSLADNYKGAFYDSADGLKRFTGEVKAEAGKIRLLLEDVQFGPEIRPEIDDKKLREEVESALAKVPEIELPVKVKAARDVVQGFKDDPARDRDDPNTEADEQEKYNAELRESLDALNKFTQAQQKAEQVQRQLRAASLTGIDKEIAGYKASEDAFAEVVKGLEDALGVQEELRASLDRFRQANARLARDAAERNQVETARLALGRLQEASQRRIADLEEQQAERRRREKEIDEQILEDQRKFAQAVEDTRGAQERYFEILGSTSFEFGAQRRALEGLRAIERDRLEEQLRASTGNIANQREILALYDEQTARLIAQQRIEQSDRRRTPYLREDIELAIEATKELEAAGVAAENFDKKFDALFKAKRDLRDAVGAGVGSLRSEITELATDMQGFDDLVRDVGRTIQTALVDRLISQPIAEFAGKGLNALGEGLGFGQGPEPTAAGAPRAELEELATAITPATVATNSVTPAMYELATAATAAAAALATIGSAPAVSGLPGLLGGAGSEDPGGYINTHELGYGGGVQNGRVIGFGYGGAPSSYSDNGVFNRPTRFPMANGDEGFAGERGQPELIFPAARTPSGKLGVEVAGGAPTRQVVNNYHTNSVRMTVYARDANSFRKADRHMLHDLRQKTRGR